MNLFDLFFGAEDKAVERAKIECQIVQNRILIDDFNALTNDLSIWEINTLIMSLDILREQVEKGEVRSIDLGRHYTLEYVDNIIQLKAKD